MWQMTLWALGISPAPCLWHELQLWFPTSISTGDLPAVAAEDLECPHPIGQVLLVLARRGSSEVSKGMGLGPVLALDGAGIHLGWLP